jgi:hypothetical protein
MDHLFVGLDVEGDLTVVPEAMIRDLPLSRR